MNVQLYFGAKMVHFVLYIMAIENIFKTAFPLRVPTNPFAGKSVLIFYIIYVKS